jgi:membrane-bound lytic murein transglycosylase
MAEAFDVYQVTGTDDETRVLFTGYYEPLWKVSAKNREIQISAVSGTA